MAAQRNQPQHRPNPPLPHREPHQPHAQTTPPMARPTHPLPSTNERPPLELALLYQRRIESPSSEFLGGLAEVNDSDNTASREWETLTLPTLNLVKDNELNTRYSTSDISDELEEDLQKVGIQLLTLAESEYINIQHDVRTFGNPYGYIGCSSSRTRTESLRSVALPRPRSRFLESS